MTSLSPTTVLMPLRRAVALALASTAGGLAALTLLAVLVPAWRAANVRPSIALREP